MIRALLFGMGVLLGACASRPVPPPAPPERSAVDAARSLESKTVALLLPDGKICSGVWVSETQILTANHCVADLDAGDALAFATHEDLFPKGSLVATSTLRPELSLVAAHDEAHDIAVLSVPAPPPGHGVAVLRGGEVHQGERAQSMGHPLGLWFSYSSGDVAAVRKKALGGAVLVWLQSTAPISPGSSGGGLFDSDERLIGIAVGILEAGQALNLFVPAIYLRPLLASQGVQ